MFINAGLREVNLKIVYYGPGLAGKTTNLQYIHARMNPTTRGDLVSLKTREDRTLFFDFMQLEFGEVKGLKPRFSLYTVPGQVRYAATRRLVLQGADGVVFVADSRADRMAENLWSLAGLEQYLGKGGLATGKLPIVLQCNKQDLPSALAPADLRVRLGWNGAPCFGAVATQGTGVLDTLRAIINRTIQTL